MTAQFPDSVQYRGKDFAIAGKHGTGLFEPSEHGFKLRAACSACWRGYVCTYAVEGVSLLLDRLAVFVDPPAPTLFEVAPQVEKDSDIKLFDAIYPDLKHAVPFTGGLLLGDEFIDELYVHMGFHPAWKFREVHELVFRGGELVLESDRSEQIAEFRDAMADRPLRPDEEASQKEIRRWIEQCFSQDYKW